MTTYKELDVWNKAMLLVKGVYGVVKRFPQEERYALSDQMRRAAVSIPSNIAEGFGQTSRVDFARFLDQARGSLYELETQFAIASMLGYIAEEEVPTVLIVDISKMLRALIDRLRTAMEAKQ